jgi:hypothetical protein
MENMIEKEFKTKRNTTQKQQLKPTLHDNLIIQGDLIKEKDSYTGKFLNERL